MSTTKTVAGLLLILISNILPVSASDLTFTVRDAERQRAFLRAMDAAAIAAKRGNRTQAQTALRRAVLAGGYSLPSSFFRAACGHMAFEMPIWVMTAQAEIGDIAGACETANYAGSAYACAEALHLIAFIQRERSAKPEPFLFEEVIPAKTKPEWGDDFRRRKHDYSVLHRLRAPADPAGAMQTLRLALPYAQAEERVEIMNRPHISWMFSVTHTLSQLAIWQAEIGDIPGAKQTVARIQNAPDRITALFELAGWLQHHGSSEGATLQRQAEADLTTLSDAQERATVYYNLGFNGVRSKNVRLAREGFSHAAEEADKITDVTTQYDALFAIFSATGFDAYYAQEQPIFRETAEDKEQRKRLLLHLRDLVPQMPVDPPVQYNPLLPNHPPLLSINHPSRFTRLTMIADYLRTEIKDKEEAKRTLDMAENLAKDDKDEGMRVYYNRAIEIGRRNLERIP